MGKNAAIRIHRTPQPHFPTAPRVSGRTLQSKQHTLNAIEVAVLSTPECGSLARERYTSVTVEWATIQGAMRFRGSSDSIRNAAWCFRTSLVEQTVYQVWGNAELKARIVTAVLLFS
jgi:hypothetical protein